MWKRLFQRLMNLFKAKANDALDRAEDPVQMMKLAIAEMEQSVFKSTEALSKAIASQKNLAKQSEQYRLEGETWMSKATQAIKTNQDDLGKKALEKKAIADKQYEQYNALAQNSEKAVVQLKEQLDRMKAKLEEARAKESILSAKLSSAKAQKEIAEQLGGVNYSPLAEFNKYEKKILEIESQSEAMAEIVSNENKLEKEFAELETEASVNTDYELIKEKLIAEEENKKRLEAEKKNKKIDQMMDTKSISPSTSQQALPPNKQKILGEFINEENKQKKIDDFFNNK